MPDEYDLFVSYARADNREGWIDQFLAALKEEHRKFVGQVANLPGERQVGNLPHEFTGGRCLEIFFDRDDIPNFASWETEIFSRA